MKKTLLLLLAIAAIQMPAIGQKWKAGVQAGPSLTSLSGSQPLDALSSTVRWTAGATLQYSFNKRLSMRGMLGYEGKGAKAPMTIFVTDTIKGDNTGAVTPHIRYNYITLPLMLQYTMGRKVKYYACAGPYIGYLAIRRDVLKGDNTDPLTVYEGKQFDRSLDWGASAGVGASVPVKNRVSLSAEVRHNIGFQNLIKVPAPGITNMHTRTTNFLMGVNYDLGFKKPAKKQLLVK